MSKAVDLAHQYWQQHLKKGDWAIDATCGNGKDTQTLAKLVGREGLVIGLDIQPEALAKTQALLTGQPAPVKLFLQSHETFPPLAYEKEIKLIVYNLGYLPGGDKTITTQVATTLESLKKSFTLLSLGGMISLACYPGHEEGEREEQAIIKEFSYLSSSEWVVCHHRWVNQPKSPSLFIIRRII